MLPRTAAELDRQWRTTCTTAALRYEHLTRVLGADRVRALVSAELSSTVLGAAFEALDAHWQTTDAAVVAAVLEAMVAARRYALTYALLSDAEVAAARHLAARIGDDAPELDADVRARLCAALVPKS